MENKTNYISPKKASAIIGVHWMTLRNWEVKGLIDSIRTPGGKRMYNVDKYLRQNNNMREHPTKNKRNICYCRVSTRGQSNDLERQIDYMKTNYPTYEIFSEIGSGLNFKRKKLMEIVRLAIEGEINEIVISFKDRYWRDLVTI